MKVSSFRTDIGRVGLVSYHVSYNILDSFSFFAAHNIDSVCIEALSVTINDRGLDQATRSLGRLSSEVSRLKASDSQRLQNEYQNLVNGLIDQGLLDAPANDAALGSVS